MRKKNFAPLILFIFVCMTVLVFTVQAETTDDQNVKVLYQTSFESDPHWITNSPSSDYWYPSTGQYHFSIEPSTGGYAYVQVPGYEDTSFNLDYDLILTRVDEGATFRMAFSGNEMNPEKGPSILTKFTNAKFGQIMWLQVVTPGNKLMQVNSQNDDTAYSGSTVKYELNKTYHVLVQYNKPQNTVSMKVSDKQTGREYWGYFIKTTDDMAGMSRLWLGSVGDFGQMNIYAQGYLDNVRITVPQEAVTAAPSLGSLTPSSTTAPVNTPTRKPTTRTTVATPYPTATTQSPISPVTALAGLGIAAGCIVLLRKNE